MKYINGSESLVCGQFTLGPILDIFIYFKVCTINNTKIYAYTHCLDI